MKNKQILIRVTGLSISAALGLAFAFVHQASLGIAVTLGLLGAVITLLLDIAISFSGLEAILAKATYVAHIELAATKASMVEELGRSLKLSKALVENRHASESIGAIVESMRRLEEGDGDGLFLQEGERELLRCAGSLKRLADGDLIVEEVHRMEKMIALLDSARPGDEVCATSYVGLDDWWNTAIGRQYLDANRRALIRGVVISRVFILKQDEILPFQQFIEAQRADGVIVSIAREESLEAKYRENFFLVGDQALSYAEYSREGRLVAGHVTRDRDRVKDYAARFRALALSSMPADEVYKS